MAKNNRRRRGKGAAQQPQPAQPASGGERYQKFLPEWMRGNGSSPQPVRAPRPRRTRQPRPAGGYTPGKLAIRESRLDI